MTNIENLLKRFAEIKGEATNKKEAIELNKDTYISIDKNFAYGGYRLERVKVASGGVGSMCYGMHSTGTRLKTKEMESYLIALINANNLV